MSGYDGTPSAEATKTVIAPINTAGTSFNDVATFDEVENRPQNNALNTPVEILNGCLNDITGRNGSITVGIAFNLTIPAYTLPSELYSTIITYTITDCTEGT
jgi:hypothetical protein